MTTPTPPGLLDPDAFETVEDFQKALLEDGAKRGWKPFFSSGTVLEQSSLSSDDYKGIAEYYEALVHFTPTAEQRRQFAKSGAAMPDGSFYIRNVSDLDNAIKAVGRATPNAGESEEARRNAVRRHIMSRARALKLTNKIPDTWNADGTLKQSAMTGYDEITDLLIHYGVLGMKWGVHRSARHPVSPEAARARELERQVKKEGTQTLTNRDLQDLVTRVNLERQYANLNPKHVSAGRKLVQDILRDSAKQMATQFIVKNTPKGISWVANQSKQEVARIKEEEERSSANRVSAILRKQGRDVSPEQVRKYAYQRTH